MKLPFTASLGFLIGAAAITAPVGDSAKGAPATQPANAGGLPPDFAVFNSRNPFAKGSAATGAGGSEDAAKYVLKGVARAGSQFTIFLEEMASQNVIEARDGQAIAGGTVVAMDLDGINFVLGDQHKRVEVGQNLNGQEPPPPPPPAPATAPSPAPPSGPEAMGGPNGPGGEGMRRRGPARPQ